MSPVWSLLWVGLATLSAASEPAPSTNAVPTVMVVIGAPGEPEYQQPFQSAAELWTKACERSGAHRLTIGLDPPDSTNDLEILHSALTNQAAASEDELWLVFVGHGTFDGKEAKFNLRGPDLSASQLAEWLAPFTRPIAVINSASSSSPFLNKLSKPGRVVITATRSGYEQNYTRFGRYFSEAVSDLKADLDKDGQVSLLEAFLRAASDTSEFYRTEGRLATEHALLDDNGDGLGTPPDWFRGVRAVKKAAEGAALDGLRAHQFHLLRSDAERKLSPALRQRRNELELAIEELRGTKEQLDVDEYYRRLEILVLELARLYETADNAAENKPASGQFE